MFYILYKRAEAGEADAKKEAPNKYIINTRTFLRKLPAEHTLCIIFNCCIVCAFK